MSDDGGLYHLFRDHLPKFDWTPIETGPLTPGVPDANACHEGCEFWVEFKQTSAHAINFRPMQPSWILRRARAGGRVWVAVRRTHAGGPRLGPPVDELWLVHGLYVADLEAYGLRLAVSYVSGRWTNGPRYWPWPLIGTTLLGR